jgi:predicted permease
MNSLIQDIRYGWKLLWKDRGLTVVAILSLALGIGANTTIFSVANAFFFRPLPVMESERLVSLFGSMKGLRYAATSYPDYADWRDRSEVFSGLAAYAWIPMALKVSGGSAEVISGQLVTGNYFSVLGVDPVLGRAFLPEEDQTPGTHPVVIISHGLWKRRFGLEREIVGRNVRLNGLSFTVIGVAPEGFIDINVGFAPDAWVPLMMESKVFPTPASLLDQRDSRWLQVVGRLKPGVSQGKAESAMKALASNLEREYPDSNRGVGITLAEADQNRIPLIVTQGFEIINFMGVLLVLVGVVLLIACSNVASLLLARTSRRWREIALRQSLGAGRGRLVRQLLTESLMLSVAGGLAGLLVAVWGIDLLQTFEPPMSHYPFAFDLSLDKRVLGYTALLSVATGVVFGLAPALQTARKDQSTALNDPGLWLGFRKGRSRLRSFLVTAQVAFAVVSLVSAGLFLQSARNAQSIDPGFDTDQVLCASLNLGLGQYDEPSGRRFFHDVVDRIEALPSVQSASLAQTVPLGLVNRSMTEVSIDGYEPAEDESMLFYYNSVGPRYFETLGIPIVKGRGIEGTDRDDTMDVAVVNEAMARRYWRGADPIGRTIKLEGIDVKVVGIARNGKYIRLGENPRPYFYVPLKQNYVEMVSLHVRTFGDPRGVAKSVSREVEALDADLPVWDMKTMDEHLGLALFVPRTAGVTLGIFGLLALALAVAGVFGVLAYSVSQGTREFGVRMAMGARPSEILKLVMRKGFKTTLAGIVLGLLLASAVGGVLTGYLYDVSAVDSVTFVGVPLVLLLTALVACYVPARRAARVDPNAALRHE